MSWLRDSNQFHTVHFRQDTEGTWVGWKTTDVTNHVMTQAVLPVQVPDLRTMMRMQVTGKGKPFLREDQRWRLWATVRNYYTRTVRHLGRLDCTSHQFYDKLSKLARGRAKKPKQLALQQEQAIGWRLSPVPSAGLTCGLVASLVENKVI